MNEAIRHVRELLVGVFGHSCAASEYDYLIELVLVTLACVGEAADARLRLDGEIRRRLGAAAARLHALGIADQLVTGWAGGRATAYRR